MNLVNKIELTIPFFIGKDKEGAYLTVPFSMPDNIESFTLSYEYERRPPAPLEGNFTALKEVNVIDLGLLDPAGKQVGASGSDKLEITVSETDATPGYHPWPLTPGEWKIIAGSWSHSARVCAPSLAVLASLERPHD